MGGSDASNADPFASTPAVGEAWVTTGPHVMIFNIGDHYAGYPTTAADPSKPYVMYPNTPYAHLMIPVKWIGWPSQTDSTRRRIPGGSRRRIGWRVAALTLWIAAGPREHS